MSLVKLDKLNKAQALAALFNNAKTQGMGVLHYNPNHVMHEAEAKAVLAEGSCVDYLEGRVIKIDFAKYPNDYVDVTQYNMDNGAFAAQRAIKIALDNLEIGLIEKLNLPITFMGQELQIDDNRCLETASYHYDKILGGTLQIIPRYSISIPKLEIGVNYINNENLDNSYTMIRWDEERFKAEGLESILSRLIHSFIHASVEADKGEEK